MTVSAVQKNGTNNAGRASYLGYAVLGGLTGYALKYIIPLNKQEKNDENYKADLKKIDNDTEEFKLNKIQELKMTAKNDLAEDTFIKMYDAKTLDAVQINKLNKPLSTQVMNIFAEITEEAEQFRNMKTESLLAYTKQIRPSGAFIAIGITSALVCAILHNIFQKKSASKQSKTNF